MTFRNYRPWSGLLIAFAWVATACGDEADEFSDKSTDSAAEHDTDTETDSEHSEGVPCEVFHSYAEGCEIGGQELMSLDLMCTMMDGLFTDGFLTEMLDCFSPESCDDFIAMLNSDGSTDTGAGTDTETVADPFSICAESSLNTAEPDQANLDFQTHFCAYAMQCNGELSADECALYFTDPENLLIFNVLDTPYITDADACVYPMPACSENVTTCLDEVITEVQGILSILGEK